MWGPKPERSVARGKTTALNTSKWNFVLKTCISIQRRLEELKWWIDSIESASNPINLGEVLDITIVSDSSKQGWDATSDSSTGGLWTDE